MKQTIKTQLGLGAIPDAKLKAVDGLVVLDAQAFRAGLGNPVWNQAVHAAWILDVIERWGKLSPTFKRVFAVKAANASALAQEAGFRSATDVASLVDAIGAEDEPAGEPELE